MGVIIEAKCECGYQKTLYIGSGFNTPPDISIQAALCESCKEIYELNYLNKNKGCRKCGGTIHFYDELELMQGIPNINNILLTWGEFAYYKSNYLCPKCNDFKMKFNEVGNWD